MLQLFSSGLMALWFEMAGMKLQQLSANQLLAWQGVPLLFLLSENDPSVTTTVQQYLKGLAVKGIPRTKQGLWMQSGPAVLVNHQGKVPRSAASLTKIATTLAALETWGPKHEFETSIAATGPIAKGVLQGDLVVTGSGDPFFVWEEAIAVGQALNKLGIARVTGDLIVVGNFYMNYNSQPYRSGALFKEALDSKKWSRRIAFQYSSMPKGTPKPQIEIAGVVKVTSLPFPKKILLLRHRSMSLAQIIKQMNIYSNNEMSQILANSLGGANVVSQIAAKSATFPPAEIQLINGSGLGIQNRISPRASCAMLMAIQRNLQPHNMTIADLFPVSGRDRQGTLLSRHIPPATVVKTGTLNEVSALAGVLPTRDRGLVCFAIVNGGNNDVEGFRQQQDRLLQNLLKKWGVAPSLPLAIVPRTDTSNPASHLGARDRNQIVSGFSVPF